MKKKQRLKKTVFEFYEQQNRKKHEKKKEKSISVCTSLDDKSYRVATDPDKFTKEKWHFFFWLCLIRSGC